MKTKTKRVSKKEILENAEQVKRMINQLEEKPYDYCDRQPKYAEISQTEMAWDRGYKTGLLHAFVFVCIAITICAIIFTPWIIEACN